VLPLALTTGHKVGLAVVGAVFIAFALVSALLIPRFRARYPAGGLPAFIVLTFVLFFGMLTAVEVFGAEPKETKKSEHAAETFTQAQPTTAVTATTQTTAPTTTRATPPAPTTTTAAKPKPQPRVVQATEKEFKITLATTALKAGPVTFEVKNVGKIQHDLATSGPKVTGPKKKTALINPGKTANLVVTLGKGTYTLYCTVPGHRQLGMKATVKVT